MGRKRTGSVYPDKQGQLRYKLILSDGFVWDRKVPAPVDGGPLDAAWGARWLALFRSRVEAGWDPRIEEAAPVTPEAQEQAPSAATTVGEYVMSWLKTQTYEDARNDEGRLTHHFLPSTLAALPLLDARPRHCLEYIKWLIARPSAEGGTLAPRTIRTIANVVQRGLAQAVRDELIAASPWNLPPKAIPARTDKHLGQREGWVFSLAEVQSLCYSRAIPDDRRAIYATLFLGCCRTGELAALRLKDWDRTREPLGSLAITKSRSQTRRAVKGTKTEVSRHVPVHPALAAILAEWVLSGLPRLLKRPATPEDLIFPSRQTGKERAQPSIYGSLQVDLDKLDMRGRRAHDTRRTHISLLVDAGARREVFSSWTHGHQGDVISGYTSAAWSTYCNEMMKLEFVKPLKQVSGIAIDLAIKGEGETGKVLKVLGNQKSQEWDSNPLVLSDSRATTAVSVTAFPSELSRNYPETTDNAIGIALFPLNNQWLDEGEQLDFLESLFSEED